MSTVAPPTERAIERPGARRMGFFTDTTVCIGCKACEVACKQWNDLPADGSVFRRGGSYDHTGSLSANTWRHVRFVEVLDPPPEGATATDSPPGVDLRDLAGGAGLPDLPLMRQDGTAGGHWGFMSDVCKHCTNAGCLDACPTGALIRTEFDTVVLQPDVCNGCGYCVSACPFGVVARDHDDGRAAKCTLCYDRLQDGLEPACAKSCPTDSIQFGYRDELEEVARRRVAALHERGMTDAYLYGAGDEPGERLAGGLGAFFLLRDPPERYGLPAHADSPIQDNVPVATAAGLAAAATALAGVTAALAAAARSGRAAPAVAAAAAVAGGAAELAAVVRRRQRRAPQGAGDGPQDPGARAARETA